MSESEHLKQLEKTLADIRALLEKRALVTQLTQRQPMQRHEVVQSLVEKQETNLIRQRLMQLHPADIAYVLEGLPLEERREVWGLVDPKRDGAVLLEVSDAVRDTLLADMNRGEIISAARHLDSDELADLVPDLPPEVVPELLSSLGTVTRDQVQSALSFPEGTVGALMHFDMVTIREDKTLEVVLRYLRHRGQLPGQAGVLMVIDRRGLLRGVLTLADLVVHDVDTRVAEVMHTDTVRFHTHDKAEEAGLAFERYGLVSAPVVNAHDQLVGCLAVETVLEYNRERAEQDLLKQAGLREDEDLFAPVIQSGRNRWPWLAVNLLTAFIASRVIGLFEHTIVELVALATLMPIVASVGGNTGNQTVALVIRGLALKQIHDANLRHLVRKEASIGCMNGTLWGALMAVITWLLYQNVGLSLVMFAAMTLNLTLASLAGVFIPLTLKSLGRDPVMGSSVLLTALTDSMGFFIFLALAAWWLA